MIRDSTTDVLLKMGVAPNILENFPKLPKDVQGLLVYGSQARGDSVPGSDLDLLGLVTTPRATTYSGDVSVSYYTHAQLSTGVGTLFGAHLKRDAKILWDNNGHLSRVVEEMGEVDTDRLFARALRMSVLFTNLSWDLPKYVTGLLREARYLLRSCLYAQAIADGEPCFSVREIAVRKNDPSLTQLLASRQQDEATGVVLEECLSRLHKIIGDFPRSQHGSLEATVVNEWEKPGDVLSMAFMALGVTGKGSDYAEVEKILL